MEDREQRLREVARIAVDLEARTGCPAQMLIAQWALESQWGAKPAGQANYFGIKAASRHAKCCTVTTREVINGQSVVQNLEFADYDSLAGTYATDPNYAHLAAAIAGQTNVAQAVAAAHQEVANAAKA